ncbi:MAG: Gfo/Idh/MocA family protein [Saprospiraceae bacterium]
MKTVINWGIIAPGRIAHKFAHDLALAEGNKLHAVASRSLERASGFAAKYDAPHAFGSYEDIAGCPGLDVVYVASPHTGHCEHTLLCLENKIPVVCEKPLAMNEGQVRRMMEAARKNDTFLMEALWTRFIPLFEKTIEMVEEGAIGRLKNLRADFGFKAGFPPEHRLFNPALGGGSLLDVGIYPVFAAMTFLGKPDTIKALAIFGETGVDESCGMLLHYPGNRLAILDSSVAVNTETVAVLYGEKGTIELHGRFHQPEKLTLALNDGTAETLIMPYTGNGYYHEIMAVAGCIRAGRKECEKMPLDFSLQLVRLLDEIRRVAGIAYPGIG